jgi:hypothetical protein
MFVQQKRPPLGDAEDSVVHLAWIRMAECVGDFLLPAAQGKLALYSSHLGWE